MYSLAHNKRFTYIELYQANLKRTSLLQQSRQLILLSLQVRVSTNVLSLNENVGHGTLVRDLDEGVLDSSSVIYSISINTFIIIIIREGQLN